MAMDESGSIRGFFTARHDYQHRSSQGGMDRLPPIIYSMLYKKRPLSTEERARRSRGDLQLSDKLFFFRPAHPQAGTHVMIPRAEIALPQMIVPPLPRPADDDAEGLGAYAAYVLGSFVSDRGDNGTSVVVPDVLAPLATRSLLDKMRSWEAVAFEDPDAPLDRPTLLNYAHRMLLHGDHGPRAG